MKNLKSGKKIFSAIAALAISATVIGGAMSFINRSDNNKVAGTDNNAASVKKTVAVDTPLGTVRSQVGKVYYAGPDAQSYGDADGTMAKPFHIGDILAGNLETKLEAGDTLYVLPGTYNLSERIRMLSDNIKGTFNKYIRIVNAALESASGYKGTEKEAVLDFSAMEFNSLNRGVEIDTDFIYWYGVDIRGAGDNGMYIGGSYNTVEYCEFYNNRDTGLQLGRAEGSYSSVYQWPSYNLIKDCTSHNNYDNQTFGENADGFAAKLTVGFANVFDGCIAYRNCDDGWDLYAKTDSGNIGTVIIYNCVAYENGFLEYTRDECNSLYPTYDKSMPYHTGENTENAYTTRDGDGNGFKLGGSVMEGDVVLYNCLAYNNRMHGVTDNSNPGYIRSSYVTSYNNSAMVDKNGNVAAVENFDNHSNIDVSRQTFSYNALNYILSVRDEAAISLDTDNYRGTVKDSLLNATSRTNVIKGVIEGDTINNKVQYTEQQEPIVASEMFKKLPNDSKDPNTLNGRADSMNISGGIITSLKGSRAHIALRNSDHSVNMGDYLAKSDAGIAKYIEKYLGEGKNIGSDLNLSSWSAYEHFYTDDIVNGSATSEDLAKAERVREALTINCVEDAVYQDVEVPVKMLDATIKWTTDDTDYITIKDDRDDVDVSSSGSEFIWVVVQRDPYEDKVVKLTATITSGSVSLTRDYYLTLKQGTPMVGNIYVEDANGKTVSNGGKYQYIIDQYKPYHEPEIRVQNGLYPDSNKLLRDTEYDVTTTYLYQINTNTHAVEVKQFTPSVAGIYTITHRVSLKGSDASVKMSYKIYVETPQANLDFTGKVSDVTVNRGGFAISGAPSKATGILYAVSSPKALSDLSVANIKTYEGVVSREFKAADINISFNNPNTASYYVYYALANADGEIGSQLYSAQINRVDISSTSNLVKIARGDTVNKEDPTKTIYVLTKDLNCSGVTFETSAKNGGFMGVFNGNGHKLSNITTAKGVFVKVIGGTIMNLQVENLTINPTTDKAGFITESNGGDFYNLAFKNVTVSGEQKRVAALIGHVGDSTKSGGDLKISQVSIVNDDSHRIVGAQRVGGLIGYVQAYEHTIDIDNCYVVSDIEASGVGEAGGMVAAWEDKEGDTLNISRCYYSGQLKTPVAPGSSRLGGMLGYHKGGIGKLNISKCLSLASLHVQGELRIESLKNASPIIGNFSSGSRSQVTVRQCIGLLDEYNTEYDVRTFSEINLKRNKLYIEGENYLNLDTTTRWTIVYAPENAADKRDVYAAPYVTLNFLPV